MPTKQPQEYPVTIEIEGKRYTAFYTVTSGVITVEFDWGELRAHVGPSAANTAHRLFLEFLRGAKFRNRRSLPRCRSRASTRHRLFGLAPPLAGIAPWAASAEIE